MTITEADVDTLKNLTIITISNTSFPKLALSKDFANKSSPPASVKISLVPIKCSSQNCGPVTPEEKSRRNDVSWGKVDIVDAVLLWCRTIFRSASINSTPN